jgi:hypothetical protein
MLRPSRTGSLSLCRAAAAAVTVSLAVPATAQAFDLVERSNTQAPWSLRPNDAILRDVDGNGTIDVLQRRGSLYLNDGQLGFEWFPGGTRIPVVPPFGIWSTFQLADDVDRDGYVDLVCLRGSLFPLTHEWRVLFGQPGATWSPEVAASVTNAGVNAQAQALADFDGDQFPDLLVFLTGTQELTLYRNQQNGFFVDVGPLPITGFFGQAAVGDLDADGDLDLIVHAAGAMQLLVNDGSGGFTASGTAGLPALLEVQSVHLADADADADLDLLIVTADSVPPQLWTNVNASFAATPTALPNAGRGCAFADLDQDQRADVLLMEVQPGQALRMHCLRGTAAGFVPASITTIDEWLELGSSEIADLDGDGDGDAIVAGMLALLNDGALRFAELARKPFAMAADSSTVCAADLDGDDFPDVLSGRSVHRNGGDGWFTVVGTPVPAGGAVRAVADFDLDGDVDAVWSTRTAPAASWGLLRNQGGTMVAQPVTGPPIWGRVLVDDFDLDGYPDLATESGALLRNVGGTGFASAGALPVGARPVAAGDFDDDGDPDLVVADAASWQVFTNNLAFTFQPGASGTERIRCAVARDLDGDGDVDLAAVCEPVAGTSQLVLWDNQGGVLVPAASFNDGTQAVAIAADDVDRDGDVDLVAGWFWENLGGFTFARSGPIANDPCLFDADRDGDVDVAQPPPALFAAYPQRASLLANRQRQLTALRMPVLGRPYAIHMSAYGTPGGGDVVLPALAATRIAPLSIPGLGLLHLDPATTVTGPLGVTDSQGRWEFPFTLPATAALAGVEVYWQGLVLTPASLRLTNLLRDRLLP